MKRGDHVRYEVRGTWRTAIVRRLHRDGSVSIEPRFILDGRDGNVRPELGYQGGFLVRLNRADVHPSQLAESYAK